MVKNKKKYFKKENFVKKENCQKVHNFGKKSIFCQKPNICQKSKICLKIKIVSQSMRFGQKPKFLSEIGERLIDVFYLTKILIFDKKHCDVWLTFWCLVNILIFGKNFDKKFWFLTKNFDFSGKFLFLTNILTFEKKFDFWLKFSFLPNN